MTKPATAQLVTGMVGSAAWFDKLPKDLQQVVQEEALKAGDHASKLTMDSMVSQEGHQSEGHVVMSEAVHCRNAVRLHEVWLQRSAQAEVNAMIWQGEEWR